MSEAREQDLLGRFNQNENAGTDHRRDFAVSSTQLQEK
jgi:hypothetical protein